MSFLKAVKGLSTKGEDVFDIIPSEYRGELRDMHIWNDTTFKTGHSFRWEDASSALTAYRKCPPLAAVLNRMAQCYITGKTWIMGKDGKESNSPDAKKLRKLFSNPNPLQSWKQFEAQQQIYIDRHGYCFCLPILPYGFKDLIDCSSLWNIPPTMLDIKETNKLFYQSDMTGILQSVILNYKNTKTDLDISKLFMFRDFTPSDDSMIFPESRIRSLELPINNIIGAYESRNVLINYRGALGIFTQEPNKGQIISAPLTPDRKKQLQKDFERYGLKNHQWKFIFSEASLKWQQIGISTRELMLFEEIVDDIMRICDGYGYPSQLINNDRGPTVANTREFKAQLYQDTIIPKAEMYYEKWNDIFKTEDKKIKIEKDYSKVAVLQSDELLKWQARGQAGYALMNEWRNDMITRNRVLFLLGEDTIGEAGDVYFSDWQRQQAALNPQPTGPAMPAADKGNSFHDEWGRFTDELRAITMYTPRSNGQVLPLRENVNGNGKH